MNINKELAKVYKDNKLIIKKDVDNSGMCYISDTFSLVRAFYDIGSKEDSPYFFSLQQFITHWNKYKSTPNITDNEIKELERGNAIKLTTGYLTSTKHWYSDTTPNIKTLIDNTREKTELILLTRFSFKENHIYKIESGGFGMYPKKYDFIIDKWLNNSRDNLQLFGDKESSQPVNGRIASDIWFLIMPIWEGAFDINEELAVFKEQENIVDGKTEV